MARIICVRARALARAHVHSCNRTEGSVNGRYSLETTRRCFVHDTFYYRRHASLHETGIISLNGSCCSFSALKYLHRCCAFSWVIAQESDVTLSNGTFQEANLLK